MNYLLVTHIPFTRDEHGQAVVDSLWARDLIGLTKALGPIRVAAPEVDPGKGLTTWGPNSEALPASSNISFRGFPEMKSARSFGAMLKIRAILKQEVAAADIVHTSNFFPPYTCLSYAHDLAVQLGKKTLFVIAEDFHDMLAWEWVRPSQGLSRWRRERALNRIDQRARKSAASAALTLLHTPAAVERYRLAARRSMMIRQPGHELSQVIAEPVLDVRLQALANGAPLRLTAACRHAELKGLDLLIRAIGLLNDRGVKVDLTLYGQGPETLHLQSIAAGAGVGGQVRMPGSLRAGEELDAALRASDLFVMPHRTTDFGRAFFDAMAAGLPVLAFRTPASATTVYDGQDGFLAPLDDVQGLAERISWLHNERAALAAASRAARRRALENTRTEWFRIRANWTLSLLNESSHAA